MKKLSIWNKTFQSLLLSGEEDSVKLALILADDISAICYWWFCPKEDCVSLNLPHIKIDKVGHLIAKVFLSLYGTIWNEIGSKAWKGYTEYLKAVYEKNNTVE